MVYFISGHRDITDDEMNRLYNPAIVKLGMLAIASLLVIIGAQMKWHKHYWQV